MRHLLAIVFICLVGHSVAAQDMVERFLSRDNPPLQSYLAFRRLEARNERFKVYGWMEACVDFEITRGLLYRIIREGGSGYIRNKVLRKAMEGEREMIARGDPDRAALSLTNYAMAPDAPAASGSGLGEMALRLSPRRQDLLLLTGRVVVSDPEADLLRVEGRLSKTPSFWTRSVDVVRRYDRRGGIRVPVELVSIADVRVAGRSQFRATYEYLSVNGAPVAQSPESTASPCLVTQN